LYFLPQTFRWHREVKLKSERKNGRVAWLAWTAAVVFYFYECLVRAAPSVMVNDLGREFSVSAAAIGAVFGSYYLVYAPLQLFVGVLFDRFGGKSILVPASVMVTAGCFVSIVPSGSLAYVSIGRMLIGVGSSCAFIGVMYLATVWFHDHRLALLSGLATSLGVCGALLGQAPLSLLIDGVGWRMSFVVMAVAGLLATAIAMVFIPETPHWERERKSVISDDFRKNLFAGLIAVFKNWQTWVIGLVATCLYSPLVIFGDLWGPPYVELALGIPKAAAARVAGMLYVGWLVGGPVAGWLSDVIRCRRRLLVGGCLLSTVFFTAALLSASKSPVVIGSLLFFAGVCSSPQVICFVASLEANTAKAKGSAIAVVNMIVMLIGGMFQPVVGWLMDGQSLGTVSAVTFRNALLSMPILTAVGLGLSLFMKKGINGSSAEVEKKKIPTKMRQP
jgi:MFS family permease